MRIYPVLAFLGAAALSLPALAGPSVAPPSAGVHAAVGQRATPSVSPLRWDEVRHMHGAYLLTDGRTVTITSEGRTLFADLDGRREELVRVGESRFVMRETGTGLAFNRLQYADEVVVAQPAASLAAR